MHLEHLTYGYNAQMVAHACSGCWCRLTTAFAAHIKGTKIAISASTLYFGAVTKAQASLCKCADSPEPLLPAHEIFVLIALSSEDMAHSSLHKCAEPVFAVGLNSIQIAFPGRK